jgi:hypothetical protein
MTFNYVKVTMLCPTKVEPHMSGVKAKRTFETREEALTVDKHARAYRCPHCDKWHLTYRKMRKSGEL